ncbi:MarR family transcriptional regulator [Nonomuraea sp. NPDC050310]|uniref:MarR family winged helix-turn-helix transcriptional regulator n=1 Tax=Nonomuraea sp. NPDC050310 TaxID=3154935 RepID=UPI0034071BA0
MTTDAERAEGGLDADFGWALGTLFRVYVKAADTVIDALPGGPRGFQVLASAVQETPANQGALARQLGIDKTVMTYLVDDLVALDLVERQPDPADRRNRRIVATARGREIWEQAQQGLRHVERHLLGVLGEEDAARFRDLLGRVAAVYGEGEHLEETCQAVETLRLRL